MHYVCVLVFSETSNNSMIYKSFPLEEWVDRYICIHSIKCNATHSNINFSLYYQYPLHISHIYTHPFIHTKMGLSSNIIDKHGPFFLYVNKWECNITFSNRHRYSMDEIKEIMGIPRCEVIWSYVNKEDLENSKSCNLDMYYGNNDLFFLNENNSNLIIYSNLPIHKEYIQILYNDKLYELDNHPLFSLTIKYNSIYCIHVTYNLKEVMYNCYIDLKNTNSTYTYLYF